MPNTVHLNGLYRELEQRLAGLPKRKKGEYSEQTLRQELLEEYRRLGVRYSSFQKHLRQTRGSRRADAGVLRKRGYWQPILEQIFAIQCELSDFEGGRWMAADLALAEAARRGIIQNAETLKGRKAETGHVRHVPPREDIQGDPPSVPPLKQGETGGILHCVQNDHAIPVLSVRNYNQWVQKLGLKKPRGFTRFAAQRSNEVHQMDVSGSVHLMVEQDLGDGEYLLVRRNPRARLSKKQRDNGYRLWMIGVVDDHSGAMAVRYAVAAGEGSAWMRNELEKIWNGLDPQLPLRGLPDCLYTDQGPFSKQIENQAYLSAEMGLGVEIKTHEAYRSRSTGKVERQWRTLKSRFEGGFLSGQDSFLLSEVNAMAVRYCIEQAQRPHRYLKASREQAYFAKLPQTVRLPQDDAQRNAFRVYERSVDGSGVFRLDNVFYQVSAALRSQRVLVYRNAAGEVAVECPITGARETVQIWDGPTAFGEFQSYPETQREHTAKAREAGDWGEAAHPYALNEENLKLKTSNSKHIVLIPQEAEPQKDSPFTAAAEFAGELEARRFIAQELGIPILTLKTNYPHIADEIHDLVTRTLDKGEIGQWAQKIRERITDGQAQAGGVS